jgi:hypothetical protein
MQSVNLTDEQLWRAIAQNTNAMTALIHQQLELDPAVNTLGNTPSKVKGIERGKNWQTRAQLCRIQCRASSPLFFGIDNQPRLTQQSRQHWDRRLCLLPIRCRFGTSISGVSNQGGVPQAPQDRVVKKTTAGRNSFFF